MADPYYFVGQTVTGTSGGGGGGPFLTPFTGPNGTAAAPTYSFTSHPNTGMYLDGSSNLAFSVGGTERFFINAASSTFTNTVISQAGFLSPAGSAASPVYSFSGTPTDGMYYDATLVGLAFATNSATAAYFKDADQGMVVLSGAGIYLRGLSGTNTRVADANVPFQMSTSSANSEAYAGFNKNGAYGFLLGYSNTSSAGWPLGGLMRMITTDSFTFVMGAGGGNTNALGFTSDGMTHIYAGNANLSTLNIQQVSQLTTLSGSSTVVATIPAGAMVLMVTARVTTAITAVTGTSWALGTGALASDWGSGLAFTLGTTVTGSNYVTFTAPQMYPSSTSIVAAPNLGTFSGGAVRVTVYYLSVTAPTT